MTLNDKSEPAALRAQCDECGSPFISTASTMAALCPECAHWLYGYANCAHVMDESICTHCGWDGAVSGYVASLRANAALD